MSDRPGRVRLANPQVSGPARSRRVVARRRRCPIGPGPWASRAPSVGGASVDAPVGRLVDQGADDVPRARMDAGRPCRIRELEDMNTIGADDDVRLVGGATQDGDECDGRRGVGAAPWGERGRRQVVEQLAPAHVDRALAGREIAVPSVGGDVAVEEVRRRAHGLARPIGREGRLAQMLQRIAEIDERGRQKAFGDGWSCTHAPHGGASAATPAAQHRPRRRWCRRGRA